MNKRSLFLEFFGDSPTLRVIDFLIDNHFFDFTINEIAKDSESDKTIVKNLVGEGMLTKTRRVCNDDYYQFNLKNPIVRQLIVLDWELTKIYTHKK